MIPKIIKDVIRKHSKDYENSQVLGFDSVIDTLSLYNGFYVSYRLICDDSIIRLYFSKEIPNRGIKQLEFFEETYDVPLRYLKCFKWRPASLYSFIKHKYEERCRYES